MDKQLKLSRPQKKVILARQPRILNMAGQQSGKSFLIGFLSGLYICNFPKIKGFIAANTRTQLAQSTLVRVTAVWRDIFNMREYDAKMNPGGQYVINKVPPAHFKRFETYERYTGIISFSNGGIIYIGSLTNYLSHDGKQFGWAHLDETKDTKEIALTTVIFARLSQVGLYYKPDGTLIYTEDPEDNWISFQPCYIHTSPALGQVDWLIQMFELTGYEEEIKAAITDPDDYYYRNKNGKVVCIYSSYHNTLNLPRNYITTRLNTMSEGEALKFVYGYPFSKTGGEFYPTFDRIKHTGKVEYIPEKPIHVSFDFNVLPYMTMLCMQVVAVSRYYEFKTNSYYVQLPDGYTDLPKRDVLQIRFFKEFCLSTPLNTSAAVSEAFVNTFSKYNPEVFIYGDASGKSRIPGIGDGTNFKTIQSILRRFLNNASDRVPLANPRILKSRDFINRILDGKYPIELMIDRENCPELVKDFEFVKLGPEGVLKEKIKDANGVEYQKNSHAQDAARYFIVAYFKDLFNKAV